MSDNVIEISARSQDRSVMRRGAGGAVAPPEASGLPIEDPHIHFCVADLRQHLQNYLAGGPFSEVAERMMLLIAEAMTPAQAYAYLRQSAGSMLGPGPGAA